MTCPNCQSELEEMEFGSSYSDASEIGYGCEDCGFTIEPDEMEDFVLNAFHGDII